jgi:hypothetical protein
MAALLGVGGCASGPTIQPASPESIGPISREAPGLHIAVDAAAWQGRPRTLTDRILPLLVAIRNTGPGPLTLARSDFLLLDETNRQYLPLAPPDVVIMLGGPAPSSGTVVAPSVGVGSTSRGGTGFGIGLDVFLGGLGSPDSDTRDIIPLALPEGPVHPAAEVRGFLYFPQPAAGFRSLRLLAIPSDVQGQPRLEFEFQPVIK